MKSHKCQICDRDFKTIKGLSLHIAQAHKSEITPKDYYKQYLSDNNSDGICYCGNETEFIGIASGFRQYCSNSCMGKDPLIQEQKKQTCINKYGTENYSQTDEYKDRYKATHLEKYGVENYSQTSEYRDKVINTNLVRYGKAHYSKTEDFHNRVSETNLEKFGVVNPFQSEEIKEKTKESHLKKYGGEYHTQVDEIKKKAHETKKRKGSYNKSIAEDNIHDMLVDIFNRNDVIRQYNSKLYPFNCDFYIKSIDTYIEFQGTWTHGKEPYDEYNKEHKAILQKWIDKSNISKYYKQAIDIWTNVDVLKRTTAKSNNLNYLEIWNYKKDPSTIVTIKTPDGEVKDVTIKELSILLQQHNQNVS